MIVGSIAVVRSLLEFLLTMRERKQKARLENDRLETASKKEKQELRLLTAQVNREIKQIEKRK